MRSLSGNMKNNMKNTLCVLALFGFAAAPVVQAASPNVALFKPVTATGATSGTLSTLTDGAFVTKNTPWDDPSTVHWEGTSPTIGIDLGAYYSIFGAIIQADVNDLYRLEYSVSGIDGSWADAWDTENWWAFNTPPAPGGGMVTRPNPDNDIMRQALSPFTARYLRVSAPFFSTLAYPNHKGDGWNALSEVQVFGEIVPIPEPASMLSTLAFVASGLLIRRNRRNVA